MKSYLTIETKKLNPSNISVSTSINGDGIDLAAGIAKLLEDHPADVLPILMALQTCLTKRKLPFSMWIDQISERAIKSVEGDPGVEMDFDSAKMKKVVANLRRLELQTFDIDFNLK